MREESRNWWLQALEDLETAKANIKIKRYYASVFFSQQAAEKALKTLYIESVRDYPPKTHNMLEISRDLNVPEEVLDAVIELNPEYFVTRCPGAANGVPAEMYTEKRLNFILKKRTGNGFFDERGANIAFFMRVLRSYNKAELELVCPLCKACCRKHQDGGVAQDDLQ